jgi:ribosomal protein S12 methylthiotransferase accessory factor
VTKLDSLHVPTYCAIRPDGLLLQVSHGKGLTDTAAKVSAIMEALELYHAEHPLVERLYRTCAATLKREAHDLLLPAAIPGCYHGYFDERFMCDWVVGEDLTSGCPVWAPASAVYFFCTPSLHLTNTNGLASGNHMAEATLHALYELIERDAMTRLSVDGKLRIHERALGIDTSSVDAPELRDILNQVEQDDTKVVLLWLESAIPVHTFWAVFLSRHALVATSTFNVGWGTHIDKRVAAARALTEAAQSRLGFIHGAREDLIDKPVFEATGVQSSPAYRFFDRLEPNATWAALDDRTTIATDGNLESELHRLVAALTQSGHERVVRFDLTDSDIGIPVVKVIAPSLRFNHRLF